jgi:TonB family protein
MRILAVWLVASALPLCAQDWTPKRIVALNYYVPLARQARIQDDVEIECFLDANGDVTRAETIKGHPLFQEQARQNALLWKFQLTGPPGENKTVTLKYHYRLEGELKFKPRTSFLADLPNTIQVVASFSMVDHPPMR